MKTVGFITLGCKVNIYESNALKNELEAKGLEIIDPANICDVYIINTCSVTNMADAKSRKMIRKCIKQNPNAIICVMGCYPQTNKEALELEGIDILIGNGNKKEAVEKIIDMLESDKKEKYINVIDILDNHEYEPLGITSYDHTRAFLKIEDGCENFCTYCIIPYARGPVRSKPADDVINELINITNKGYLEVVLAGIHTGRYMDNGTTLSKLVKRILNEVPKLKRLRLSSIEINEVDDEFIELMRNNDVIADHLHLPLQSGSDLILSKMERKYDTKFFIEKVNKIRDARPNISITTDIIVGFPYETDEEFEKTYKFSQDIGFSKIHVFPYSMRKGTKAAKMPQVQDIIKKSRASRLLSLSKSLELDYSKEFVGSKHSVIVEQKTGNFMVGHTSNYLQVVIPLDESLITKMVYVELTDIKENQLVGKIVENL
ncbi:MAG: tRNA (N(6)-L-threonylcarbamoyladenosine(37)-C(2))-methylthiotransferase MtaB [Acholeplasmatales bacterium]|nr:tRNA (N(6)-L-threonylcarbamoyladenosine(37)-C(2))-methylthiotransferase MtaB [Acholeplasmatales bacterium]